VTSDALAAAIGTGARELSFAWVGGMPVMIARTKSAQTLLAAGNGSPLALDKG
jgi:hypothetical protein